MQHNLFFFFNDTATTEIYTLSLHDALPIWHIDRDLAATYRPLLAMKRLAAARARVDDDRAGLGETRLAPRREIGRAHVNSSHQIISYAVFCLKKKKKTTTSTS